MLAHLIQPIVGGFSPPSPGSQLLLDHYTDSNGTALESHTMDIGPGWRADAGSLQIQSNRGQQSGTTDPTIYTSDAGWPSVLVTVTINRGGVNNGAGIVGWLHDSANYVLIDCGGLGIYEVIAGVFHLRASFSDATNDSTDHTLETIFDAASGAVVARVDGGSWERWDSSIIPNGRFGTKTAKPSATLEDFSAEYPPPLPDVTVAPSDLFGVWGTGAPGHIGTLGMYLTWTDNSDNEDGFRIEWTTITSPAESDWGLLAEVAADEVSYLQTGSLSGLTVSYRVRAWNGAGPSPWSDVYSIAVP